jgi:hypothetical protein
MQAQEYEQIEKERLEFKELLLENPNYFGTVLDPELAEAYSPEYEMQSNTNYEELRCVGLCPHVNLLEAVIEVKLPYGFMGDLCDLGTKEYVAFYVDYGSGFVSVGAPVALNVHDIAFVEEESIFYAVRKPFLPQDYWPCEDPQVVQVRAILSWEALPTGPNYPPVWGNVLDRWVQIRPEEVGAQVIPVETLAATVAPLGTEPPLGDTPAPTPPPGPTEDTLILMGTKAEIEALLSASAAAETEFKAAADVESDRAEFRTFVNENPNYFGSICNSKDPGQIMEALAQLPPQTVNQLLPQFEENPESLMPVVPMAQNTFYEELRCIGLYPEQDLLEGIIEVKRPYGFGGDLCAFGSKEYVAFYIDWGGGYEFVGEGSVYVHDIPQAEKHSLFYAVYTRIPDIGKRLRDCSIENIVSVRAILSWNWPPIPYGPNFDPPWGNVLTRWVQIRPGTGDSVLCSIEIVNEVHVDDIDQTGSDRGLAIKVDGSGHTVPGTFDRPFGGTIACWGNIDVPGTVYYRFRYRQDTAGAPWQTIYDERTVRTGWGLSTTRAPDADGWFRLSDYNGDQILYPPVALVHWRSHGKNGPYVLRLELADAAKNPLPGQTYDVAIVLDNSSIELNTFGGTPSALPAKGIVVKDAAGDYRECTLFEGHDLIRIFGNFRDDYFRAFRLKVFGGNIHVSGEWLASGRYDDHPVLPVLPVLNETGVIGAVDGGLGREIATLDLCDPKWHTEGPAVRCAYGIELHVSDRAIVGYLYGYEFRTTAHGRDGFVTFNWDPKNC